MQTGSVENQESFHPSALAPYEAPENRLMAAVLQDAITTFQRGLTSPVRDDIEAFREVDRWFRNRSYDSPFSFECICATLGVEPSCVRDLLNRWRVDIFLGQPLTTEAAVSRKRLHTRRPWRSRLG